MNGSEKKDREGMQEGTAAKGKETILWIITAASFVITVIGIQFMPDRVPLHYNAAGEIDRYGSPYEYLLFPVIILVFNVFWHFFIRHYRKKSTDGSSQKEREEAKNNLSVIVILGVITSVMFTAMTIFFMVMAFAGADGDTGKVSADIDTVCNVFLGFFYIVIGNILPKAKRNGVVGMRTVWSMDNDKTWALSNRFAGKAFMVLGVFVIAESVLIGGLASTMINVCGIIACAIICVIQSYQVYKKYGNHGKSN